MTMPQNWIEKQGPQFISQLGIQPKQTILDFGCGKGNYTLPAAKQVGPKGKIYALDDMPSNLETIEKQARTLNLTNIDYINTHGEIDLPHFLLPINTILVFDVLHYFKKQQRKHLYQQFYDCLEKKGQLIVYPKHTTDNWPMWNLSSYSTKDLIQEIQQETFLLKETRTVRLIHDQEYEEGTLLRFMKV